MPRQEAGEEHVRKLGKTGSPDNPSYFITLPIDLVRKFDWREGQKLIVQQSGSHSKLIIEDGEG